MLSDDEALAVLLSLVAGRRTGITAAAGTAGETAAAKVRRVLPERLRHRLDAVLDSLTFTSAPAGAAESTASAAPEAAVLLPVADAVRHHRPLAIRYTGGSGERTLYPYGLVAHAGRWYVTGRDLSVGADRTFRLDRVHRARVLPGTFEPPPGPGPAERVLTALATAPYRHEVTVRVRGTAEEIRARLPGSVAVVAEETGGDGASGSGGRTPGPGAAWRSGPSGSTGCRASSRRWTARSSSSGRTSCAASSRTSRAGSWTRPGAHRRRTTDGGRRVTAGPRRARP